ncbi:Kinesin KP1 [Abeliophyllum distichum]|uniref:Kinesin KP1 n=1 Tax=Abeliophyllum distichum TaxID=126358 RepID=A0ABD1QIC1_9LAMI
MDHGASGVLPKEPAEEEFCLALRNGLILCNVLNKVNPGAVYKVVENPVLDVQATEGAAQSAIQYFENMRNFLVAVGKMKLLTFEASDLEKGGSSSKVVDCILCLKGYHEWKQSGGTGVWRYGGTVRITSFPKESPSSLVGSESADESLDDSESSQYEQLMEFLQLSTEVSLEESKAANVLTFIFDHFSLGLLQAFLTESNEFDNLPLSPMVIDAVFRKVIKDFSQLLISQSNQLGLFLKKILCTDCVPLSKSEFLKAISKVKEYGIRMVSSGGSGDLLDLQQKHLEDLKDLFRETKQEVQWVQLGWGKELQRLEHHVKSLEVAASSYHNVLEENRLLYNQVQDLKGTIRVFCRVRPFLPGQSNGQSTVDYIGENGNIMIVNPQKQGKDARRVFTFDKVFGTNVTQEQIYADTQPLIRSVLDGYNVCIFAYGQTGSGKTYTMSGPDLTTEETWGVNYRALRDLFRISKARMDVIEYEVGVQMIEIYNEQLNGLNVPDASLVPVKCTKDVLDLMKIGQRNRAVGATALNERSSRSHSILTIHVRGKELVSGSYVKGLPSPSRSSWNSHVPYRNSKLTQVLQDSLGGHAKTLMFVHINPEVNSIGETISTLKFAERVATIDLGAAQSNKEAGEIREFKEEISNLKLALERKEAELEQLKSRTNIQGMLSPLRVSKFGNCVNSKPETSQQHVSDNQSSEVRSCSSGKQRRSRVPSKFTDKDIVQKMPFLAEERSVGSIKPRSPSPPVRRSTSTDRGALIKSRNRQNTIDNPPVMKQVFPSSVSANKSVTNIPATAIIPSTANTRLYQGSQEPLKQDNVSDLLNSLQRIATRKVHLDKEDEQFKQALNVRQGGIRKSKPESKVRTKHQLSAKNQKSDIAETLPDIDNGKKLEAEKIDFSNPENESVQLPVCGTTRTHKLHRSFSRNFQNLEPREPAQMVEPSLARFHENKLPNGVLHNVKEAGNTSVPEFRRSRSTPRGKFMVLP